MAAGNYILFSSEIEQTLDLGTVMVTIVGAADRPQTPP